MERRPAPEVTIEGGPGWQLAHPATGRADDDVTGPGDPAPPRSPGRRWWPTSDWRGLALAVAVGFVTATALAEVRLTTLRESDDGVLSLEVRLETVDYSSMLITDADGRPAVSTSVVLHNTGPRPVALERAELLGTDYRSDDLAGRRVQPGDQAVVPLLRRVDCGDTSRSPAPGPLQVEGTTGAGPRTVELRMSTDVLGIHDHQVRRACGQASQLEALQVVEHAPQVDGATAVLSAELSNGSAEPLVVQQVRTRPGLRLVRLEDGAGQPLALPLELPPGDFDPPTDPYEARGQAQEVAVVVAVDDCTVLPAPRADGVFVPLVDAVVGEHVGAASSWGGDPTVVLRLWQAACPPADRSR